MSLINNRTNKKKQNFNSLIAISQEHRTPIYALTAKQLGQTGVVLKANQKKQEEFHATFSDLADKIIGLTSVMTYAVSA